MLVAETGIGAEQLMADPEVLDELVVLRAERARAKADEESRKRLRAQLKGA